VVLVGQDTTRYGTILASGMGLATLLEQMTEAFSELPWIRVITLPPPRHERFLSVLRERPQVLPT